MPTPLLLRPVVTRFRALYRRLTPSQAVSLGYGAYMLVAFLLLLTPWAQNPAQPVPVLDHLFMAVSAVSTTGLATVSTPDTYNFFGELVLLLAIQVGGLGYMTFGSFLILASGGRISQSRLRIGRSVYSMPEHFDPLEFLRRAMGFIFVVEALGAAALYYAFVRAGVESPLWNAIFHSVSAYCTAGFSLFPTGLENYHQDSLITGILSVLSLLGGIGFIVIGDLYLRFRGRVSRITLTSRIILYASFGALLIGTVLICFDPHLANLGWAHRIQVAFFQAMSAQTTVGFNTVPISALSSASVMVLLVLMILGASPSGTGGGLKSTTWSAGLGAVWSAIRGRNETTFLGSTIPAYRIQAAFAAFTLYLVVFSAGCFTLLLVDGHDFESVVFEVASALSTVGLSQSLTPELSEAGKWVIMVMMFIGRVGVVSLGLAALAKDPEDEPARPAPVEDIVVG